MPYFISDHADGCAGWATVKHDNSVITCHKTKQDAIDHMVALSLAEKIAPGGELKRSISEVRADSHPVPEFMRAAARQGLKYYADGKGGAGLVAATVREARLMAQGKASDDKWIRIAAWIARHMPDLDSPNAKPSSDKYPSPGVVAHLLWGSGPSKAAAQKALSHAQSVVEQIKKQRAANDFVEERATGVNRAIIVDIDDTLIHNNRVIADVNDWVQKQELATLLVTGRLNKYRDFTVEQLSKLGIDYDQLIMNDLGSTAKSIEFKKATAERLLKLYDVVYAVDNDGGAREAYASLGIEAVDPSKLPVRRDMTITNSPNMAAPTKQDLSLRLADLLGDVVTFKFMAHGFHWNVRGVNFAQYHEFFGEIYEDADGSIDPIAENIRKLGFNAPFRLQDFIESAPENEPTTSNDPVEMARSLYLANQDVLECIVHALACADELEEQGIVNFLAERQDMHSKWEWQLRSIVGDDFANAYKIDVVAIAEGATTGEGDEGPAPIGTQPKANMEDAYVNPDGTPIVEQNSAKAKWVKAAEMIVRRINPTQEIRMPESRGAKFETRVSHADIELREVQGGNGMTFEGYAAVFNSPSQPIGGQFTEYVAPGAFKRSLQARNDIKLLWNHDTGQVLGSTRAGTLTLVEDNRGLKAIAQLPDTQLGRDTAVLLKRGDIANMSFGFTVPKNGDTWSEDGTRTLNSVRLHEVSIVAFPAYEATSASVRSIDVSDLADSLFKLEQGETLTQSEADMVRNVVDKLTEDIKNAPAENILDLKQKKLALLAKRI